MDSQTPRRGDYDDYVMPQKKNGMSGFSAAVIIFLLAFLFLAGLKPSWVMKRDESDQPTSEVDYWKVFFGAIFLAVVVGIIVWLFSAPKTEKLM